MAEITIDPEFANLCRPLTAEEKSQLEENVKKHGCQDKLKAWNGMLIDGHNRHEICTRLGIEYGVETVSNLNSREDAINWIIANQLGRRNLIPEDVSYLRGKRYEAEKVPHDEHVKRVQAAGTAAALQARGFTDEAEKFRQNHGLDQLREKLVAGERPGTATRIGKELGVSDFTILSDAKFASAVDTIAVEIGKEAADMIRTGKSGLSKKAIIAFGSGDEVTLRKFNDLRFEEQKRKAQQRKERKKSAPKAPPLTKLQKSENALDTTAIERMRPFMNAIVQIATSPVTARTMATHEWPDTWRKQVLDSLPLARAYLDAFAQSFTKESSDGDSQAEACEQQHAECA